MIRVARLFAATLLAFASTRASAQPRPQAGESDTAAARRVFEGNVDAIHKRDRARYLSYYLQTERLTRNGPGGMEQGYASWSARRDSTWPDTLVARDLRLVPLAPGVVYGTYHYRVTQRGVTTEGISERVFLKTPQGWKIAVSTAFGSPAGASPPATALVGGTLVNPGRPAVANAVVVTRGGRVVCAGARAQCAVPPDAEQVDVRGRFVTPGLVDAHVHYSQTGWADGRPDAAPAAIRAQFPYDSVVAALERDQTPIHRAYLCSGVTSVWDVGGYPWTIDMARGTVDATDAPRVVAVGPLLSTIDHWVNLPVERQFVFTTTDSMVRAAVRSLVRLGAPAVKVWYIQQRSDTAQARTRLLLEAIGDETRKAGVPLIVHATQLARAKEAVRAGARVLVHSVEEPVDAEFLALAKERGVIDIPTLTVGRGYAETFQGHVPSDRYPLDCVDPATRAKLGRDMGPQYRAMGSLQIQNVAAEEAVMATNLKQMRDAGIPIATGTDAGNAGTAHGPSIFAEMEAMQRAGLTAAEVFSSSTIVAARAMGLERETGTIEPGKRADLIVLDADPTADIANARRLRLVMRNGALYGREELVWRERR